MNDPPRNRLSWQGVTSLALFVGAAICTVVAVWYYWQPQTTAQYLSVTKSRFAIGTLPIGQDKTVNIKVQNSGDRALAAHYIDNELC